MVSSAAVTAYLGASAQAAMALGLPKSVIEMGDDALRTLTSAMPLIEGLDRIAGIGISPATHIEAGTSVSANLAVPSTRGNSIA